MQVQRKLELKISGKFIGEESFSLLVSSQQAEGSASEKDADSGVVMHMAWFAVEACMDEQFLRLHTAALLLGVPAEAIDLHALNDDWEHAWQRQWKAAAIGETLWVRPSFCEPPIDQRIDIILDPGMAFGTGTHATTQLCLSAIEHVCKHASPQSMLDMGTGSGILAIAAAKLGVPHILAIDYDSDAVNACVSNAEINHVTIDARLGDTPPERSFDLVVANILARPLIDMATSLATTVEGVLILSGLLQEQAESVSLAYQQQGLTPVYTKQIDEWVALTFTRE